MRCEAHGHLQERIRPCHTHPLTRPQEELNGGVHKIDLINWATSTPSFKLLSQEQLQLAEASFRDLLIRALSQVCIAASSHCGMLRNPHSGAV